MIYLKPVMPQMAERAEAFLGSRISSWKDAGTPLTGTPIGEYQALATRVDPAAVKKLVETQMTETPAAPPGKDAAKPAEIDAETFARMDLRIGRIEAAELVEGADRLLRLTVDLGADRRTIFAGIREAYDPASIVGRHVIVVANMKPRKLRFGVSEGMVLAASGESGLFLVGPDAGAQAGMKVS